MVALCIMDNPYVVERGGDAGMITEGFSYRQAFLEVIERLRIVAL